MMAEILTSVFFDVLINSKTFHILRNDHEKVWWFTSLTKGFLADQIKFLTWQR